MSCNMHSNILSIPQFLAPLFPKDKNPDLIQSMFFFFSHRSVSHGPFSHKPQISRTSTTLNMAILSTLMVVLTASGTLGSALPGRIGTPKAFSVQQVHNPTHVRHGPTELFRAYRKFGAPVPQSLHAIINANKAAVGNGSGSAVTTPEDSYDVGVHHSMSI